MIIFTSSISCSPLLLYTRFRGKWKASLFMQSAMLINNYCIIQYMKSSMGILLRIKMDTSSRHKRLSSSQRRFWGNGTWAAHTPKEKQRAYYGPFIGYALWAMARRGLACWGRRNNNKVFSHFFSQRIIYGSLSYCGYLFAANCTEKFNSCNRWTARGVAFLPCRGRNTRRYRKNALFEKKMTLKSVNFEPSARLWWVLVEGGFYHEGKSAAFYFSTNERSKGIIISSSTTTGTQILRDAIVALTSGCISISNQGDQELYTTAIWSSLLSLHGAQRV